MKNCGSVGKKFICIVDTSKQVDVLGSTFALPVEVIPMARSQVARKLVALGGSPEYREGVVTDNGNVILDVYHFAIMNPVEMEKELNNVPGVVTNGILLYAQQILLLSARLKVPKSLNNKKESKHDDQSVFR